MKKTTRHDEMRRMLPIKTTDGFITGLICDDFETKNKGMWPYSKCCQDPRNWEGKGEWRPIAPEWQVFEGGTAARDVYCRTCETNVIAHEVRRFVKA